MRRRATSVLKWFSGLYVVLIVVQALLGISLTMLIGWAGQVSLGHFAVVGVGAYLTSRLVPDGWTLPGLLLAAGALGAAFMVVLGLPALRVQNNDRVLPARRRIARKNFRARNGH